MAQETETRIARIEATLRALIIALKDELPEGYPDQLLDELEKRQ